MDKETFIERALKIHGDKYDYSKLPLSFKVTDNIPITCPKHGVFLQIARNHVSSTLMSGCPICGKERSRNTKSDTFEEFVEKARKVHGDKYEYLQDSFVKTSSKLQIKCIKCGNIFTQKGTEHLQGCGCSFCNKPHKRLTTEEFKERIGETHPNLEVLSDYISTNKPITVRCKIHDKTYTTTPHMLIQGSNCEDCYNDRRGETIVKPMEEVLERVRNIHDEYTFPFFQEEYVNSKSKVTAVCKEHGAFKISVNKLLSGQGCRKCATERNAASRRMTVDRFIEKVNKNHSMKYTYPYLNEELVSYDSIISIVCPKHGMFKQCCGVHSDGHGCPTCRESRLEASVSKMLEEKKIPFERQKKFEWLVNDRTNSPLSLDFYLPEHNVAIECQGEQHFSRTTSFGGKENFQNIVYRDMLKNSLCTKNHIQMLYVTNVNIDKYLKEDIFRELYSNNMLTLEELTEKLTYS